MGKITCDKSMANRIVNHRGGYSRCVIGSNPTMYDFVYNDPRLLNLSIGRSGLDTDFYRLKDNRSSLDMNAKIYICIMPFYSILGNASDTMKTYDICNHLYSLRKKFDFVLYLLRNSPKRTLKILYKNLFRYDGNKFVRNAIQRSRPTNMDEQVDMMCNSWKAEFDITDFSMPLTKKNEQRRIISNAHLHKLIKFCKINDWKPIFIIMPMSQCLSDKFSTTFRETYIQSFIKPFITQYNIPCMDYSTNSKFLDNNLYSTPLFLNERGAKIFTQQVIDDTLNL